MTYVGRWNLLDRLYRSFLRVDMRIHMMNVAAVRRRHRTEGHM